MKTARYTATAGNNSTDLGVVGAAKTIAAARKLAKMEVKQALPYGEGSYKIFDEIGQEVEKGQKHGAKWVKF